jgi:hypothetical protein
MTTHRPCLSAKISEWVTVHNAQCWPSLAVVVFIRLFSASCSLSSCLCVLLLSIHLRKSPSRLHESSPQRRYPIDPFFRFSVEKKPITRQPAHSRRLPSLPPWPTNTPTATRHRGTRIHPRVTGTRTPRILHPTTRLRTVSGPADQDKDTTPPRPASLPAPSRAGRGGRQWGTTSPRCPTSLLRAWARGSLRRSCTPVRGLRGVFLMLL